MTPLGAAEFAALMEPLGPLAPNPRLALAISGGADSMALALLAASWARAHGGRTLALIVDHGLRPESAAEAQITAQRLALAAIPARILTLTGLGPGPGLAARARAARHETLETAAAAAGYVDLLYAHHAVDQAETVLIRELSGSGTDGLAGMAPVVWGQSVRRLRPLLTVPPGRLRAILITAGQEWVEDPSNRDPSARRARLRAARGDAEGTGIASVALAAAARGFAERRRGAAFATTLWLAAHATLRPEGFALLPPGPWPAAALAALLRSFSGAPYPPSRSAVERLAGAPKAATIFGLRLLARRSGWLLAREEVALGAPVPAQPGVLWDRRFRLAAEAQPIAGATIEALGTEAACLPRRLPAAVSRTLPAIRLAGTLAAVPHLDYPDPVTCARFPLVFAPAAPTTEWVWDDDRAEMRKRLGLPM